MIQRRTYFYRNEGKGKFSEDGLISGTAVSGDGSEQGSMGVAVGDYLHHSGNFAIYMTNFVDEYNALYRNNGNYDFTDVSFNAKVAQVSRPYVGWGTGFFDLDNDTWLDLFVVNGHVYPQMDQISSGAKYKQGKLLFINNGDATFCNATTQAGAALSELRVSRGAAFGDLDNDGNIDIVVEDLDSSPMILKNEGDKSNHWVTLELGAKQGNPLAIGARIKVTTGKISKPKKSEAAAVICRKMICGFISGSEKQPKSTRSKFAGIRAKSKQSKMSRSINFTRFWKAKDIVPFEKIRPKMKK